MSDHADPEDSMDSRPDGVEDVEAYETEEGVVFYDAQNPLAWLKTTRALTLKDQV